MDTTVRQGLTGVSYLLKVFVQVLDFNGLHISTYLIFVESVKQLFSNI